MLFFNYRQMGSTVSLTPVGGTDSTRYNDASLTLNNAKYRYAYLTRYVIGTQQKTSDVYETGYAYTGNDPELVWNMGTILYADFSDNNLSAGNINHLDSLVQGIVLRRRTIGDTDIKNRIFTTPDDYLNSWIPVMYKENINTDGLNFTYTDHTAPLSQKQEYELVLILKNGTEQLFSSATVVPSSERIVVLDHSGVWSTCLTDAFCDSNRVYPVNVIAPLFSRQPTIFRNSLNNYETVSVSGNWLPSDDGCCGHIPELDKQENTYVIVTYRRQFVDFLTNNNIKLVKNVDGRMWLGFVTSDITDNANGTYNIRNVAFTLTENGNWRVARDLYEAGFIDKNTEEWW